MGRGAGEEDLGLDWGRIPEVGSMSWWIGGQTDLGLSTTLLLINWPVDLGQVALYQSFLFVKILKIIRLPTWEGSGEEPDIAVDGSICHW